MRVGKRVAVGAIDVRVGSGKPSHCATLVGAADALFSSCSEGTDVIASPSTWSVVAVNAMSANEKNIATRTNVANAPNATLNSAW